MLFVRLGGLAPARPIILHSLACMHHEISNNYCLQYKSAFVFFICMLKTEIIFNHHIYTVIIQTTSEPLRSVI